MFDSCFDYIFIAIMIICIIYICTKNNKQTKKQHYSNITKPKLALYYANWCGHCHNFMKNWDSIKSYFDGKINCEKYECSNNEELCKKYKIVGFPTMILHYNGKNIMYPNDRPRTKESVIEFVNSHI